MWHNNFGIKACIFQKGEYTNYSKEMVYYSILDTQSYVSDHVADKELMVIKMLASRKWYIQCSSYMII